MQTKMNLKQSLLQNDQQAAPPFWQVRNVYVNPISSETSTQFVVSLTGVQVNHYNHTTGKPVEVPFSIPILLSLLQADVEHIVQETRQQGTFVLNLTAGNIHQEHVEKIIASNEKEKAHNLGLFLYCATSHANAQQIDTTASFLTADTYDPLLVRTGNYSMFRWIGLIMTCLFLLLGIAGIVLAVLPSTTTVGTILLIAGWGFFVPVTLITIVFVILHFKSSKQVELRNKKRDEDAKNPAKFAMTEHNSSAM